MNIDRDDTYFIPEEEYWVWGRVDGGPPWLDSRHLRAPTLFNSYGIGVSSLFNCIISRASINGLSHWNICIVAYGSFDK